MLKPGATKLIPLFFFCFIACSVYGQDKNIRKKVPGIYISIPEEVEGECIIDLKVNGVASATCTSAEAKEVNITSGKWSLLGDTVLLGLIKDEPPAKVIFRHDCLTPAFADRCIYRKK